MWKWISLVVCLTCLVAQAQLAVGTGIYDVTGPAAEVGMMGYARIDQQTGGIHTRLWARAFVIDDQTRRVALVNVDLGMVMQAVKSKVVEKLKKRYGNLYHEGNVMLTATHTHSGPGGHSHYGLYNITILGFCRQNFDAVVDGIYQAIVKAHDNVAPAEVFLATGTVENATKNRSIEAYNANIDAIFYPACDSTMTVLKFQRPDGRELGMISFFAVHATSMGNTNKLVSGDNKGWAERRFEQLKGSDYLAREPFVAAFANSALGDVSPNIYGGENGGGVNDFASTEISGQKQLNCAWDLYHNASRKLTPRIDYRHAFTDFSDVTVTPEFTGGQAQKTAFAALGLAFAAGAEDGPSNIPFIKEGDYKGHYDPAHGYKPIFLETGKMKPFPWTPEVLPTQIFTIGEVAILAVPGEFTTHSGRRIKETVRRDLERIGVEHTVITGPANAYVGYVTTREEYNEQHYEGASTHFGQWTLGAFRQQFKLLAESLAQGTVLPPGPTPRDLSDHQTELQPGVICDAPPLWGDFGDVETDAPATAERMKVLKVVFWGAHPKNDLKTNHGFFEIQRRTGHGWEAFRYDYDLDTAMAWDRYGIAASKITVLWDIPQDAPCGTYRVYHSGAYKELEGAVRPYSGRSREFAVVPCTGLHITSCKSEGSIVTFLMKYPDPSAGDLGHKDRFVTTGKIRFKVNDQAKIYEALPRDGKFTATEAIPDIKTVTVPAGYAVDACGNTNAEYHATLE